MIVSLWWTKEGNGHWRFVGPDSVTKNARWVRLEGATTDMSDGGFLECAPDGPRGIMRGELKDWEPWTPPA
jgi:hypothetical protein